MFFHPSRMISPEMNAAVRLREHGHTLTGEVFVVPLRDSMSAEELIDASGTLAAELERIDWRLHGLMVVPVRALEETSPPRVLRRDESRDAAD